MSRNIRLASLLLSSSVIASLTSAANAQSQLDTHNIIDDNGVDQLDGTYHKNIPLASIGGGDAEIALVAVDGGADNYDAIFSQQTRAGSVTTITIYRPNEVDRFSSADNYTVSQRGTGAKLVTNSNGSFRYVTQDGASMTFGSPSGGSGGECANFTTTCSRVATAISSANGRTLFYNYFADQYCRLVRDDVASGPDYDPEDIYYEVCDPRRRLASMSNNAGYRITFLYQTDDTSTDYWMFRTGAYLSNDHMAGGTSISFTQGYTSGMAATGKAWSIRFGTGYRLEGITLPGESTESITIGYDANGVSSVTKYGVTTYYSRSTSGNFTTATRTDANGKSVTTLYDRTLYRPKEVTDALSRKTTYAYTPAGLLDTITRPEGDQTVYSYDARGNVTSTTVKAKPSSGQSDIAAAASYPSGCTNDVSCNSPVWTRDAGQVADAAKGQTDYAYEPASGLVSTITAAAPTSGAIRPQTHYEYITSFSGARLLSAVWACRTTATCQNGPDQTRVSYTYDANDQISTITQAAGDNSLSATKTMTYDFMGNVVAVDGPLGGNDDRVVSRYDADRKLLGIIAPDPDGTGPRKRQAQRLTYSSSGQPTLIERGTVPTADDAGWSSFSPAQQLAVSYDAHGRKVSEAVVAGGTTYALIQYSYDALGRPLCTVVRLNGADADACAVGQGANGPDRVSKVTGYDDIGRVTQATSAFGTAAASVESTVYTPNGRTASVTDANGNVTSYVYDGYDRLSATQYPSPTTPGASNAGDYEQLSYDANGNVTSRRLRDNTTISYSYDALNRLTYKVRPGTGTIYWETNLSYAYDLLGHLTSASDSNGHTFGFGYDALGRKASQSDNWYAAGNASMQYDAAGRRTRLNWWDGFYVGYDYDVSGQMTAIRENGGAALVSFAYDDLGRRTSLTRANGATTGYSYDPASRLSSLTQDLAGTAGDLSLGFTYNAASQIASRTSNNDLYAWSGAVNVDRAYDVNGLNRYTSSGSVALGYDGRGNLNASGTATYAYTSDNQLAAGPSFAYAYDALGRLFNGNLDPGLNTTLSYDDDRIIAETDQANGQVLRRYVFGPGTDEPLVWYEGTGTTDKRWLAADERGSVIAVTNAAGNAIDIKTYDEFGIPADTTPANAGRFGYTGQAWLPGSGLSYYKARMYSPTLGRFMQTDPIGYGDGLNWYNYTGGDPINATDPSGLDAFCGVGQHYERRDTDGQLRDTTEITAVASGICVSDGFSSGLTGRGSPYGSTLMGGGGGSARQPAAAPPATPQNNQKVCNIPTHSGRTISQNVADLKRRALSLNPLDTNLLGGYGYWLMSVGPGGQWAGRLGEPWGNYNFGATGRALGIPLNALLRGAGAAEQLEALTGRTGSGNTGEGNPFGSAPYGDNREGQEQIRQGYYAGC